MKVAWAGTRRALTRPNEKYIVDLSEAERNELLALTSKGTVRARKMKRAQILLKADLGATDAEIMAALWFFIPAVRAGCERPLPAPCTSARLGHIRATSGIRYQRLAN